VEGCTLKCLARALPFVSKIRERARDSISCKRRKTRGNRTQDFLEFLSVPVCEIELLIISGHLNAKHTFAVLQRLLQLPPLRTMPPNSATNLANAGDKPGEGRFRQPQKRSVTELNSSPVLAEADRRKFHESEGSVEV